LDARGEVLAHSRPELTGAMLQDYHQITAPLRSDRVVGWFQGQDLYLSGRRLSPAETGLFMHGPGLMMHRVPEVFRPLQPRVILVGLKTAAYLASQREQMRRALILAGLLFLVGLGAIYLVFVLQTYRTVDQTLSNLSTYTAGIVDNMPNGLVTLDGEGQPVVVNQAAREMLNLGKADDKSLARHPALSALAKTFLPRLAQGGRVLEQEFTVKLEGGRELPLAVSAASAPAGVEGGQGPGTIMILRDLRRIKELEAQVRQSEKMAAVGRLAAGVAHEVRNPLSSMRGLARFLARGLDEASREAEYLKVMVNEIDRLNRVVTGLLDFARPRQPDLARLDLNDVIRHTLGLVRDDARHQGVDLAEALADDPVLVLADRDQATQAILNILLNGLEAMPQGGRLTVASAADDGYGRVVVADTGPGIPPEDRSRLFDPFFTTKKQGTGLGLAQVARIMEAHGGRVTVDEAHPAGAAFSLYFPVTDQRPQEAT
jgi:two-component system sensor histidine kinase HydH